MTPDTGWHLDKKVPISIIVALFAQFGGGLWYIGRIESRIAQLEHDRTVQTDRDERQDKEVQAGFALLRSDILEMNRKLDRLIERR